MPYPLTAAYTTIGTQTVSSYLSPGYELLLLAVMAGFAIYDICHKRVPNKALAFSLTIFLAAPFLHCGAQELPGTLPALLNALLGVGAGFGILLLAALLSKSGAGVGGGDIKLAAAMGFAYGPHRILIILLLASVLCLPAAGYFGRTKKGQPVSLPFVPFMATGCLVLTAIRILS